MRDLIAKWRKLADEAQVNFAAALLFCADELEQEWHDLNHDAEFIKGCPHCDREKAECLKQLDEAGL